MSYMITMTATDVARNFSDVLDRVERGETVAVTRKGKNIATLTRPRIPNGKAIKELLAQGLPDATFAHDVMEAREAQRAYDIANPRPIAWEE